MNIERVRTILGVWAPMGIGLFIIATSINFYITAQLADNVLVRNLEGWRLVCSAGAFFVGSVLMLSTYGRYQKTKAARREAASSLVPALPPTPQQDRDQQSDGDDHDDQQPPTGG